MNPVYEQLKLLEGTLSFHNRWALTILLTVVGLHFAAEFGTKIGKALYYFSH